MSEIAVRITELQNAAERLKQSAFRLQVAVDSVVPIVDQSLLDALPLSENAMLYQSHKANIASIPAKIQGFAQNLSNAADDISVAVEGQTGGIHVVHFYAPTRVKFNHSPNMADLLRSNTGETTPTTIGKMSISDYISARNRHLYDGLTTAQHTLNDKSSAMTLLMNKRENLSEDLTALKNRLLSYDASTSVDTQPRVMMIQGEIDALDLQIDGLQNEITGLRTDVSDLTERLNRVAPATGAELEAIVALEATQDNPLWMQNSTYGCVNHIVDKMPLPNGVPRDALLWDDAALQLPQYGISWGETPLEGSVLQLDPSHPYADDQYGHVLYVESVQGDTVWVTDNLNPDKPVRLQDLTSKLSGEDMRYLYFPWHTGA